MVAQSPDPDPDPNPQPRPHPLSLRTYPKYAMGGGYVLSGDVARTLIGVNRAQR